MSAIMKDRVSDRTILGLVSLGLISIILSIVIGIFTSPRALPNWAENVLISISSVAGLKLGDCLSTLVQLAMGQSSERLGTHLAGSQPLEPPVAGTVTQTTTTEVAEETKGN